MEQNYETAILWLQKAAEQNEDDAFELLGDMYGSGMGVKEDREKAVDYYKAAAGLGSAAAQNKLGDAFLYGDGIAQSYDSAME